MISGGPRCVKLDANDIKAAELLTLLWRGDGGSGVQLLPPEMGKKEARMSGTGKKKEKPSTHPRKRRRLVNREVLGIP